MKWLEVSIRVRGEQVESVADLFATQASGGVVVASEGQPVSPDESTLVTVCAYLPADQALEDRRGHIEEGLWHLSQIQSLPSPSYRYIEEQDWAEAWKRHFRPMRIGRRLMILPPWAAKKVGRRLPVVIDPGMAFGTGAHPSTRLCLEALERHLAERMTIVDLGCGSGILSIAAARLGAGRVLALDTDSRAVEAAADNAARNALSGFIQVQQGSLAELLALEASSDLRPALVLANLVAAVLEEMLDAGLASAVIPGGKLILAGILQPQAAALLQRAKTRGLRQIETLQEQDWLALVLGRESPPDIGGDQGSQG